MNVGVIGALALAALLDGAARNAVEPCSLAGEPRHTRVSSDPRDAPREHPHNTIDQPGDDHGDNNPAGGDDHGDNNPAGDDPASDDQGSPVARDPSRRGAMRPGAAHGAHAPLGLAPNRIGSGTTWQPDSTPMDAWSAAVGSYQLMLHGNLFLGLDAQASERGATELTSINWVMAMLSGPLAGGELALRAMLSAEPWTMRGGGYPVLLQTGESFHGEPLHDRQHPHDLFMELAVMYGYALGDRLAASLYLALPGEPALGPIAFPHRRSAYFNPFAALGHHWQDATHISFGVVTAGVYTRRLRLEASAFNGREPDERRTDLETAPLDSFSGRLQLQLAGDWVAQVSAARLQSPEQLHPEDDVTRMTASATWNRAGAQGGNLAATGVWGANLAHGELTHSALVEGAWELTGGRHVLTGRAEVVQKSAEELVVPGERVHLIGALTLGYLLEFPGVGFITPGVGVAGNISLVPRELEPSYGTRVPIGGMVFVHLRPPAMKHDGGHQATH